jgi:hypothetical protein
MRRDSTRQGTTIQPTEKPPPPQIMPPAVVMEMPPAVQAAWTLRWPQMPRLIMLVVSPPYSHSHLTILLRSASPTTTAVLLFNTAVLVLLSQEVFNLITIHKFPT